MVWEEVLSKAEFDGNILTISDFFLNPNESFTMYIVTDGQPDIIRYGSRIADVDGLIIRNTRQEKIDQWRQKGFWISGTIMVIVICVVAVLLIWDIRSRKRMKEIEEKLFNVYKDAEIEKKQGY